MKQKKVLMAIMAIGITFTFGACNSDDEAEVHNTPDQEVPGEPDQEVPEYLTPGTAQRPQDWVALGKDDYPNFEFTMSLQVQLGDTLVNFQSGQDLMCVTINNEIRAVAEPQSTLGEAYFPLTIAANSGESTMTLSYYCDRLHRIYVIPGWASFNPGLPPSGDSGIYRPQFTNHVK